MFSCLSVVHIPKDNPDMLGYRAAPGMFIGYSISTTLYFVYDSQAKTLLCYRDVGLRDGMRYTAPTAADDAMLNEHFSREVIKNPKPTEKKPTRDESSKDQTEKWLGDDTPLQFPNAMNESREYRVHEMSLGDAWKPLAEGSHWNCAGRFVESAQLGLKDVEFKDMIPMDAATATFNNHEDMNNYPIL